MVGQLTFTASIKIYLLLFFIITNNINSIITLTYLQKCNFFIRGTCSYNMTTHVLGPLHLHVDNKNQMHNINLHVDNKNQMQNINLHVDNKNQMQNINLYVDNKNQMQNIIKNTIILWFGLNIYFFLIQNYTYIYAQ